MQSPEGEFAHLHKLASVGKVMGCICHELNSPLTAILGLSEILLREAELNEANKKRLLLIHESALRMMKIISGVLSLSRKQQVEFGLIDLSQIIRDTVSLFKSIFIKKQIDLRLNLVDSFLPVYGNFYQLQQALFNLIMNATQALEGKQGDREITIGIANLSDKIEITIADNGPGIKEEHLNLLCNPFFTTKQDGTGLGLNIVEEIIALHGGKLYVSTKEGEGTEFVVALPKHL